MLQLRTTYELDSTVSREYKIFHNNTRGTTYFNTLGSVYRTNVDMAFIPLAYNNIGISHMTYGIDNAEDLENYKEEIQNRFENLAQDTLDLIYIFTPEVTDVFDNLDSDLFINIPEPVQGLYDKAMAQASLREERTPEPFTKVKISRSKHMLILVSNYPNDPQVTDLFLTLGLTPVLFTDWKDRFNEDEINYFKTLVNRSQVKRISNVKAVETFSTLINNGKYQNIINEMRTKAAISNVIQNRISQARRTVDNAESSATEYLRNYNNMLNKFYEAQKILKELEENKQQAEDEVKLAITMEGISNIRTNGDSSFVIPINVPLIYFDSEEAECAIKHIDIAWLKQMLTDLFIEQKYKMYVYTEFYFAFSRDHNYVKPGELPLTILDEHKALFNPHTYFYSCLGDYLPKLIDAQAKQDLLLHNNIALASAKSINFRDGAVIGRWVTWLKEYIGKNNNYYNVDPGDIKCIEDEEGNRHSIKELYFNTDNITTIEPQDL